MKLASFLFTTVMISGLVLMGCDSPTTSLLDENANETITETASKGGSKVKVTGSGHFFDVREDGGYRTFSFTAQSTGGQWQIKNRAFDVRIHGSVDCVTVVDNEAWFAGPTTQSDDPDQIGVIRGFYVVDNGQGNNNTPDQISTANDVLVVLGDDADAADWCTQMPRPLLFAVENGNVKVH